MNYLRGHLPYVLNNWNSLVAIIAIGILIFVLIYVILHKDIRLPLSINIGLMLIVVGLYPVLDGLAVDFTGDKDSVAFRWTFIVIGMCLVAVPAIVSYMRAKKKGCQMKMNTDWTILGEPEIDKLIEPK